VGNSALVARAQAGDRAALGEIYTEYADRLYDFCFRIVRDHHAAADALQDTFVLVVQRLSQLRDPERLRPWLYAIARHVSFRYLDSLGREAVLYSVIVRDATDAEAVASEAPARAASLVEDAAEGMSVRDRAVLELHERHGLTGDDLMAAIGLRQANPSSLVHRAREQLERAVGVLLLARMGRNDCLQLDELLHDWDGSLTPLLRKRIGRHADKCPTCSAARAKTNPLALLAAVPMLIRPARADAAVLEDDVLISARFGLSDEAWPDDGFPPPLDPEERERRRMPVLIWAAGVVFIAFGVLLIISAMQGGDGSTSVEAGGPSTSAAPAPTTVTRTTRPAVDATTTPPATEVVTTVAGIAESVPSTPTTRRRATPTTRRGTPTTSAGAPAATPTAAPATTPHTSPSAPTGTTTPPSATTTPTTIDTTPPPTSPPPTDPPPTDPPPTDPPTTTETTLPET
jgi:RNA polymerase sigma factor (sigma-70 family)